MQKINSLKASKQNLKLSFTYFRKCHVASFFFYLFGQAPRFDYSYPVSQSKSILDQGTNFLDPLAFYLCFKLKF